MRTILFTLCMLLFADKSMAASQTMMPFSFKDADLTKVIEDYAKASGQKFIIDSAVKGKVTILNPQPVTISEAFNQLSTVLAINSLAISTQDDVMTIKAARSIQRDLIDVGADLPPVRPEKMFTWIVTLKYADAEEVNKQLRVLSSKDGELVPYSHTNQLFITDWTPNLHRVAKMIDALDVQAHPNVVSKTSSKKSK